MMVDTVAIEFVVDAVNFETIGEELAAALGGPVPYQTQSAGGYNGDGVPDGDVDKMKVIVRLPETGQRLVTRGATPDEDVYAPTADPALVEKVRAVIEAHDPAKPSARQQNEAVHMARQADLLARIEGEIDYFAAVPESDLRDGTAMRRVAEVLRDVLSVLTVITRNGI